MHPLFVEISPAKASFSDYCQKLITEKKLKIEMLLNFAKMQGYEDDQLKRLEDILARSKDMDEAISEFRSLKGESANGNGKHIIAESESELLKRLNEGWSLVQNLNGDRFLLHKP